MTTDLISEKKAIQQLAKSLEKSWNAHDAKTCAESFAEDADFTTVFGTVNHGRKTIEEGHAKIFSTVFKNSRVIVEETTIRFIKPDVASVHLRWKMIGATFPDGSPWKDRKGLLAWTVVHQSGQWKIVVAQNSELAELPPGFYSVMQDNKN